jgi:hypothetical protein
MEYFNEGDLLSMVQEAGRLDERTVIEMFC